MIVGYFKGFGEPVSNRQNVIKKEWIFAAATAAGGLAKSLFGGARARRLRKRAEQRKQAARTSEKAWYDKQYGTDYLDTAAGRNLMRRAQEVQDTYIKRAEGSAAVGGATEASVAQAKEAANRTMGNTIANIAAADTSRKQSVADTHLRNQQAQAQEDIADLQGQAQQASEAGQQASNSAMTAAGTLLSNVNLQSSRRLAPTGSVVGNAIGNTGQSDMLKRAGVTTASDAVSKLLPTIEPSKLHTAVGV